jgi:murein DD-endopeptidase MepM/ murein hydrolase activator NlpD
VVLDLGDGVYAALAHLRRGSVQVTKGQRVTAGQQIAECGNSGNSSEPHLHFQLMDHAHASIAAGLPFTFQGSGVPRNLEPLRSPADLG